MEEERHTSVAAFSVLAAIVVALAAVVRAVTALGLFGMDTVVTYWGPQLAAATLIVFALLALAVALRAPSAQTEFGWVVFCIFAVVPAPFVVVLGMLFGAHLKQLRRYVPDETPLMITIVVLLILIICAIGLRSRPAGSRLIPAVLIATGTVVLAGQLWLVLAYIHLPTPSNCCPW